MKTNPKDTTSSFEAARAAYEGPANTATVPALPVERPRSLDAIRATMAGPRAMKGRWRHPDLGKAPGGSARKGFTGSNRPFRPPGR